MRVGDAIVPIAPEAGNESILNIYIELVRRQRGLAAADAFELRLADIAALAPVLDLDDGELHAQLVRIVGLSIGTARRVHAELLRRRVLVSAAFGAAGVAALAGVGVIHLPLGSPSPFPPPRPSTALRVTPSIGDAVVVTPPPTTQATP